MMSDHATFASLQIPTEWGQPKFQLGQTVTCDDGTGFIVGALYQNECSMDATDDPECIGWWFWICVHKVVNGRHTVDIWGKHQDVIRPAVDSVGTVARQPHDSSTPVNILEPLLYGAF